MPYEILNILPQSLITASAICFVACAAQAAANWPQFRGPNASGVAEDARPPVHFGPGTNLLWKTDVPPGLSAPIVWGNHVFLTALASNQLVTLAFDAGSGQELWRRVAPAAGIERSHDFSSPAASTACTDGERVYAYFGSFGLLAYDFAGKEIWRRS
jgi:outer membrane protein assembly factor BamB